MSSKTAQGAAARKRKRQSERKAGAKGANATTGKRSTRNDDLIASDSEDAEAGEFKQSLGQKRKRAREDFAGELGLPAGGSTEPAEEEEIKEDLDDFLTADEKRLRMAKDYLEAIQADKEETDEEGDDTVAARLERDVLKSQGKLQSAVAQTLPKEALEGRAVRVIKGHRLPATCVAVTEDETTAYTGSKDGSIVKWDLATGQKLRIFHGAKKKEGAQAQGHTDHVLALAVTPDGSMLASGGHDKLLRLWDTKTGELKASFKGHKDSITGLAVRQGTKQLFSASRDRTIKIWDLDQLAYVDTLYGHQAEISAVHSLTRDRCVSCGADKSVRLWKVPEETSLVYRGGNMSVDSVSFVTEEQYFAGGQDGSVQLFSSEKKKPVHIVQQAHGGEWVCSVAARQFSDLAASGSSDGFLRFWAINRVGKAHNPGYRLAPHAAVPLPGFINALTFTKNGRYVVAAIGQEHRFGRWTKIKQAKNGIMILPLGEGAAKPIVPDYAHDRQFEKAMKQFSKTAETKAVPESKGAPAKATLTNRVATATPPRPNGEAPKANGISAASAPVEGPFDSEHEQGLVWNSEDEDGELSGQDSDEADGFLVADTPAIATTPAIPPSSSASSAATPAPKRQTRATAQSVRRAPTTPRAPAKRQPKTPRV